jgi:ATP-dependent Lhr-like helicase
VGALSGPLELFHPVVRAWFERRFGRATDIQERAWPRIAAGDHVLVAAPTGSGKTLTAFLWAIDRLLTGAWPRGAIQVLYISPLKALNTDVRRNLERPLAELALAFEQAGERLPAIRAMTRSGDTPEDERRKMVRHPPEILITTPESLNVLLTSKNGRALLGDVRAVILDEVHAVAGGKRGTHLITAVERVAQLAGEFQRIALSATVEPMAAIGEFVGGYRLEYHGGEAHFLPRQVSLVRSTASKRYDLRVRYPGDPGSTLDEDGLWDVLARDFRRTIRTNRSTLLFANSRRLTEKVTRLINHGQDEDLAYSHHGSLSREVRSVVEERLKKGQLKAIVATNSLELGIDIGDLDEVLLIQTPRSFASAIQRIGRAGHGVGQVSRGRLYPTHGRDFLDAAVVARAVLDQQVEALRVPIGPLDVAAQVLLSMCCGETWSLEELYDWLRTAWPYRHLSRKHFDLLIDMLAGRYADSRLRELRPRLLVDQVRGTATARAGSERLLYMAGGTIFDRGYFTLRHQQTGAKIGELDEEFVWERTVGDAFTLGAQSWQVRQITHNDMLVLPARGLSAALAPFWRADSQDRGFPLCQGIAAFLEKVEGRLAGDELVAELAEQHAFEPAAAQSLLLFLREQTAATGDKLPRRDRILVERCRDLVAGTGHERVFVHTFWGGTVNRPLGMALAAAWQERYGAAAEVVHDDYGIMVRLPEGTEVRELFALLPSERIEQLLRLRLEATGFFGSRFRSNASTALLLPRTAFNQRMPLWLSRQRAKQLHESVAAYGDFPIVLETWRTCLHDDLAIDDLKRQLDAVRDGHIGWVEVRTHKPSPLTGGTVHQQTQKLMYDSDQTPALAGSLRSDLLQELVHASHLRPRLPAALAERLRLKIQRLAPGYPPRPGEELQLFLEERLLLADAEWLALRGAVEREHEEADFLALDLLRGRLPGAQQDVVLTPSVAVRLARLLACDVADFGLHAWTEEVPADKAADLLRTLAALEERGRDRGAEDLGLATALGEFLRFHAVVRPATLSALWGFRETELREHLETLREQRMVVVDQLLAGSEEVEVCDARHLETLLRWLRQAQRPEFRALPIDRLPLFLAVYQGLTERGHDVEALQQRLERLFGLPLPAGLWEKEILPARLDPYYSAWLDATAQDSDLLWLGCGAQKLTFLFQSDLELVALADAPSSATPEDLELLERLLPEPGVGHDLLELADRARLGVPELHEALWRLAWAGHVTNDLFLTVRRALQNGFEPPSVRAEPRRLPRRGAGWKPSRPVLGLWSRLPRPELELDALEREERVKDRVRLLLQRWGLLCRELLQRELPALQWSRVFRTLRLMELSGELLAGHFFEGIPGLQFIDPNALRTLERALPEDSVFWLNAGDPASLCGVDIESLKSQLPARSTSTHLVYHGATMVLVSKRRGKDLEVRVAADHPRFLDYCGVLKHLLGREVEPLSSILVETVNGEPAAESPYLRRLETTFRVTREGAAARLWRTYGA